jgi:hypothetical protein
MPAFPFHPWMIAYLRERSARVQAGKSLHPQQALAPRRGVKTREILRSMARMAVLRLQKRAHVPFALSSRNIET